MSISAGNIVGIPGIAGIYVLTNILNASILQSFKVLFTQFKWKQPIPNKGDGLWVFSTLVSSNEKWPSDTVYFNINVFRLVLGPKPGLHHFMCIFMSVVWPTEKFNWKWPKMFCSWQGAHFRITEHFGRSFGSRWYFTVLRKTTYLSNRRIYCWKRNHYLFDRDRQ